MLLFRSRWHVATNRLLLREARLCMFAGGAAEETQPTPPEPPRDPADILAEGFTPPEGRAEALEQRQQRTRERAANALEGERGEEGEAHKKTERQQHAENVLTSVNSMHDRLQTLHSILAAIRPEDRTKLTGAARETWLKAEAFVGEMFEQAKLMRKTAWEISEWEFGNRSPHQLYTFLEEVTQPGKSLLRESRERTGGGREARGTLYAREGILHAVQDAILSSGGTENDFTDIGTPWETRDQSLKITAVETVNRSRLTEMTGGDGTIGDTLTMLLNEANNQAAEMQEALQEKIWKTREKDQEKEETMEEFIQRINTAIRQHGAEAGRKGQAQGLLGSLQAIKETLLPGIRFYTPLEVWEAITKVKDAYLQAYKERSSLRSDILAKQLGQVVKILPWGGADVPHVMETRLDEANDKVKDHHVESLKKRNVSYDELFVIHHNELEINAHDGNRARAVLEYAASRGWLYDSDLGTRDRDNFLDIQTATGRYSLRQLVPGDWSEQKIRDYESILLTQQNKGKKDESEKYYNRYYNIDEAPRLVALFSEELDKINIWGAHGIMKRALERGLIGEVSPLLIVTLITKLQRTPLLRRVFTKDALDQMGALALYNTYFTAGWLKMEDETIFHWTKEGNPESLLYKNWFFGRHLQQVRDNVLRSVSEKKRLHFTASRKGQEEFDRIVARIFAAQTVEIEGKKFSIFQKEYDEYRSSEKNPLIKGQADIREIGKEDDDYVRERPISDVFIGSKEVVNAILKQSNGHLQLPGKAKFFLGSTIDHYQELQKDGLQQEAAAFRKEMGGKLGSWLKEMFGDSRNDPLFTSLEAETRTRGTLPALPILAELGFFTPDVRRYGWEHGKGTLPELIFGKAPVIRPAGEQQQGEGGGTANEPQLAQAG